jgi:hypothetical protein
MPTFNLKRFSDPGTLRAIEPGALLELLASYEEFLTGREFHLPTTPDPDLIDYDHLAAIFMTPDVDTPDELANALFYIHEMATADGMDALMAELQQMGEAVLFPPDSTPADVAVRCWLVDPEALERAHAESLLIRPRSFQYFQTQNWPPPGYLEPAAETLALLENELDNWFEQKNRGRGARVFPFPKDHEVWFLIRHGDPFKREGSLENEESSSVFYRPERHDVLVYDQNLGELRMNARSKGERDLYLERLGLYLLGSEHSFRISGQRYTLEPLRTLGQESLVWEDVDGLEWVVLRELWMEWGGPVHEVEIRKADDLFTALELREETIPQGPTLRQAKFQVKFSDGTTPRTVTIRVPQRAQFTRDQDSALVEEWLTLRGFVIPRSEASDEAA